jgi:hypothetical protein
MYKFLKKIGVSVFVSMLFLSFAAPIALAQENPFDTLDDIKQNVETPQSRPGENKNVTVKLVDFSNADWPGLNAEVRDIMIGLGFKNLDYVMQKAEYKNSDPNTDKLVKYIGGQKGLYATEADGSPILDEKTGLPVLNDYGNMVVSAIRYKGESQLYSIVLTVAKTMRNLIGGLAVIWIIISGIRMIMAQGEENIYTEQKQSITYAVIGLIAVLLIERGVVLLYGAPGQLRGIGTTGAGLTPEILGVISFIKALIGAAAILMIMISGYRLIASMGEEEKITNQKKAITWVVVGIVLILINQFIVRNLYEQPVATQIAGGSSPISQSNVTNLINLFGTITQYILGFVGLIAFAALIYGAASMIANFGNDELVERAKKIIKNSIIGIIIIISAFAIVSTLIKF